MPKLVILGSCRHEPYEILFVPKKIKGKWNTEEGYKEASKMCYPTIDKCNMVIVYAPDGLGEHTTRDMIYALKKGKPVILLDKEHFFRVYGEIE